MKHLRCLLLFAACLYSLEANQSTGNRKGEYELKTTLMSKYFSSVRPVRNFMDTVDVRMDIALRAIVDLDEKNQILTTNTWIRLYWKDAYLTWNPQNYSGIIEVNFPPDQLWRPDLVLYNSADDKGRGLLDFAMKTNIIVRHDGSCSWFCPMVLKSDCTIDIQYFPFDRQSCPLQFGLWTYDGSKANLSLQRRGGADLRNYLSSGEWVLEGVPTKRNVVYYLCCPNAPYPDITFSINMIRRTKFYLMNLIWPGVLIACLAAFSYFLPPECGERVGLGITNLLAMMVFLLLISESIPPTSESIPLASKFFSSVLVLSALTLLSSALAIKFTFFNDSSSTKVPWFITVVLNGWMAKVLLVETRKSCSTRTKKQPSEFALDNVGYEEPKVNYANGNISHGDNTSSSTKRAQNDEELKPYTIGNLDAIKITQDVDYITGCMESSKTKDECKHEWRMAAKVVDRFFLVCFVLCVLGSVLSVYIEAPRFYVG